jgi:hypothetical protein
MKTLICAAALVVMAALLSPPAESRIYDLGGLPTQPSATANGALRKRPVPLLVGAGCGVGQQPH